MTLNGTVDIGSIVNNNTYHTNYGVSMTHIINGMAGNGESHVVLGQNESAAPITAKLDQRNYGFSKLRVINSTAITFSFIQGNDGSINDELTLIKKLPFHDCTCTRIMASSTKAYWSFGLQRLISYIASLQVPPEYWFWH